MLKPVLENPWVRAVGALLALVAVGALCFFLKPVLVALFLAFLVAYVLDPVVDFFEARRVSRSVAIGALAALGFCALASVPLYVLPRVVAEADALISSRSASSDVDAGMADRLDGLLDRLPLEQLVKAAGWVEPDAVNVDARAVVAEKVGAFAKAHASQLTRAVFSAGGTGATTAVSVFASVGRGTVGVLAFLGNLVLFTFVAGYLLKDFDAVVRGAKALVPPRYRGRTFDVVRQIDKQIRGFLRGQAVVCLCLGVMYGIGLVISGIPFAILIAAFGGVASFVPYLGLILTIGPALALGLLQHGLDWHVVGVIVTFAVAQTVEGSFLTPKIVGDQVGLNPVWVILAIMVFSSALGFLGLLLAVPIAAALKVLVAESVAYYRRSPLFEAEDGSGDPSG